MRLGGTTRRLIAALAARSGKSPVVEEVSSRPWASATFSGTQHRLSLRLEGPDAGQAADRLCGRIDEAEFELGSDLLVDIAIAERCGTADGVSLTVEALTVEAD